MGLEDIFSVFLFIVRNCDAANAGAQPSQDTVAVDLSVASCRVAYIETAGATAGTGC